ncbi:MULTISPECIES: N-methyl-L-tryptophan oxidase [Streptomyces]|uniref:Sarcosine oxidase n=2 Tax=Streptomyces TaxID=1883 RepID=A0ABT9L108_9ACTN|nr:MULTISPECIES: N-methyl-L-tryptophan oxidase [Streptomyces]MBW8087850.1 N-methyl-L-tryptophan oxidase [Streptomyces hygroscopicus subsp. hygroscopicus]MCO8306513.1 N-methyl-L-tryptophan oxidase [Streptomyces sp. RKCA744]MDP9614396.1 sarcosine oxidase [Streptomyces demainii]GHJ32279.1 N-methyltryptophan oxidase [Streptomyces hygroscopicus]
MDAQVGVVGLGAAGSAALWRLAARGADVVGIEQFTPGHDRGSSHGHSRLFRMATSEGPQYAALARRAHDLWRELERVSGERLLDLPGGLSIGAPDSDLVKQVRQVTQDCGLPHDLLDHAELLRRYPQHRIADEAVAVLDPATGFIRPEAAIRAAARTAVGAGARIIDSARVEEILPDHDGVLIRTSERDIRVGTAVVAAGAWLPRLLPDLAIPLRVRRAILTWFTPRPGREELFTPERFPVFTHQAGDRVGWGAPMIDATGVKVGMQDNGGYLIDDPYANAAEVRPEEYEAVTDFVRTHLPDLVPQVRTPRGCMITMTPDEAFSIGFSSAYPRVVLLAACSGHGFKHASAVGDIGADLALGRTPALDISGFSPDRFR